VIVPEAEELRAFSRFYTRVIGVLEEGFLHTRYTLTEARVLFELGRRGTAEVAELRAELALDAGYLSRILARFEEEGLVVRGRSEADGRRQTVRLAARGRKAFTVLDARSSSQAGELLAPLSAADRARLTAAMRHVRRLLRGDTDAGVALRELRAGDLGWVVQQHGQLYASEYGWDEAFEALVARIVGDFGAAHDPARERGWIAEVNGDPVGCVFCVRKAAKTAQLRLLLVQPSARGLGIGTRLVGECIEFARGAGYRRIVLWTNDVLVDARRIYERAGFRLVEEAPHHAFGHDLVEQTWALAL
jgi:DNA-binding MarR family transcriptional regulator/GNAT superfamily N-acetyltransferase